LFRIILPFLPGLASSSCHSLLLETRSLFETIFFFFPLLLLPFFILALGFIILLVSLYLIYFYFLFFFFISEKIKMVGGTTGFCDFLVQKKKKIARDLSSFR